MFQITRKHEIHCGHRVVGHESKCQHLHGHSYVFHLTCAANELDDIGRVIDFSVIKQKLCMWLEEFWDHKFLAWDEDALISTMYVSLVFDNELIETLRRSIAWVPFNPTAENIAQHMVNVIGPQQLAGTGVTLIRCTVEETNKCSATYEINND